MTTRSLRALLVSLLAVCLSARAQEAPAIKLYIFDNGGVNGLDPALFNFTREEVAEADFVVTSNLIGCQDVRGFQRHWIPAFAGMTTKARTKTSLNAQLN